MILGALDGLALASTGCVPVNCPILATCPELIKEAEPRPTLMSIRLPPWDTTTS